MMNPEGNKVSSGHNHGGMNMDMGGENKTDHSDHAKMDKSNQSASAEMNTDQHTAHQMEANLEHAMFKVSGNCDMCKATIETAAGSLAGVNVANWNIESKQMHVSFNKDKTSLDKIHKAIAAAGYDTDQEVASEEAYNNLPPCCQYTR
jgi:Cu(I)/Ag(I) efflux system membrane fusion protein